MFFFFSMCIHCILFIKHATCYLCDMLLLCFVKKFSACFACVIWVDFWPSNSVAHDLYFLVWYTFWFRMVCELSVKKKKKFIMSVYSEVIKKFYDLFPFLEDSILASTRLLWKKCLTFVLFSVWCTSNPNLWIFISLVYLSKKYFGLCGYFVKRKSSIMLSILPKASNEMPIFNIVSGPQISTTLYGPR